MNRKTFLRLLGGGAAAAGGLTQFGCGGLTAESSSAPSFIRAKQRFGAWTGGYDTPEKWRQALGRMSRAGMNTILPGAGDDELRRIIPLAREEGIDVHAWRVQMRSDQMIKTHPEWYAVSRNGVSTAVKPPYVNYYQFMCPSREDVREWVTERARAVAKIDGLASVHLDYIRLPDVILPVALWPKYNIVQDREYAEYDFCYCEVCREKFRAQTGLDPLKLEDAPSNEVWRKFRWDAITAIVNQICAAVHEEKKPVTAAVFPTPTIARALVRQDWTKWNVDALMPMIYNGFYNEPVGWVGSATRECVQAVQGRTPIHTGLYVPDLKPAELARATALALEAGSQGVILFDLNATSDEHLAAVADILRQARVP
ncbi:MAG: putative glycoside hydrolase [Longimicrobiales bacterium]